MRLCGYAAVENVASIRVLTKSGLHLIETREHAGRPHAFFMLETCTPEACPPTTRRARTELRGVVPASKARLISLRGGRQGRPTVE